MKMLYISTSRYKSNTPNFIQVSSMVEAFKNKVGSIDVVYKSGVKDFVNSIDNCNEFIYNSFNHYYYLFKCILLMFNKDKYDLIYTRNIFIAFIASIITKSKIVVEIHCYYDDFLKRILYKMYCNRYRTFVVSISNALTKKLYNLSPLSIITVHDSHSFKIERTNLYDRSKKVKIGYFGSIKAQKGESILRRLIENFKSCDFYIYSKDLNKGFNNYSNVKDYQFLEHDKCEFKMKQVDCALLFVVPQVNTRNDISPYTSPLKLFEYAAKSVPIIANDVDILREVLDDESCLFFDGSNNGFANCLKLLDDKNYIEKMKDKLYGIANDHTWEKRVENILSNI